MKENKDFFSKYNFYVLRKIVELRRELLWFSKVDLFRQEGFYCDYKDNLKSPLHLSESEFKTVISKLGRVRKIGIGLIEILESENEETKLSINKAMAYSKKTKVYDKIEKSFDYLKKSKQKSFSFFKAIRDISKLNNQFS